MREKEVHSLERYFWGHAEHGDVRVKCTVVRTRKIVEVIWDAMMETWADSGSVRTPGEASVVVPFTRTENLRRKVCMTKSAGSCRGPQVMQ